MSDRQKYSVSYDWSFEDIGGRVLRYFSKRNEVIEFVEQVERQIPFNGVVRGDIKMGGVDDK